MGQLSSVLMPLLQLGALGFTAYVFIYSLAIEYLLRPSPDFQSRGVFPRKPTAVALITVFSILLLILMVTWMRLLQVIWTNPGLMPLGKPSSEKQEASQKYFEKYDAFIADYDGDPLWCNKCHNFKPDRTHHCRELNRCVRRMDHYCPWAGGIISETTHKFFIQFVFYGTIITTFTLVPMAYFLAERIRLLGSKPATWIAATALAGIFCIFTGTMFFTTFWNLSINYTTIETVQRGGVHNIAMLATAGTSRSKNSSRASRSPNQQPPTVLKEVQRDASRSYVLFQTQPFDHPWDIGTWPNLQSIMGYSIWQWLVPLKMSPCIQHDDIRGEFGWAQKVLDMAAEYQEDRPGMQIHLLSDSRRRNR
ncbi:zf-DHHC-domain-containing protein [Trematosphaeria pertusa]|uniref:Palmitoyltransferase n=1 Tax=Trematosphaeria pertusa TaxID=390896 RepID=A0A6A6ILV3_9PLEO|nr:zf-DHHC-domain-containing protein [Trematosphaeria pertusa]KAF2251386.1 zf-DHHC-domain-containing protein [Trematosphaeria pertusa]